MIGFETPKAIHEDRGGRQRLALGEDAGHDLAPEVLGDDLGGLGHAHRA